MKLAMQVYISQVLCSLAVRIIRFHRIDLGSNPSGGKSTARRAELVARTNSHRISMDIFDHTTFR